MKQICKNKQYWSKDTEKLNHFQIYFHIFYKRKNRNNKV